MGRTNDAIIYGGSVHLFVTGPASGWDREAPIVWFFESELYARPEGTGLLLSPCDQTPVAAPIRTSQSPYDVDHSTVDLLASKLAARAPGLMDVELRRGWALANAYWEQSEPWQVVKHAARALHPGGLLVAYTPQITQAVQLREALGESAFGLAETIEVLHRGWHIEGQSVRPDHRMVAHTAFLTTARRLVPA